MMWSRYTHNPARWVYHGTFASTLPDIAENGLRASPQQPLNIAYAAHYGGADIDAFGDPDVRAWPLGVLLRVRRPRDSKLETDFGYISYKVTKPIPPDSIEVYLGPVRFTFDEDYNAIVVPFKRRLWVSVKDALHRIPE